MNGYSNGIGRFRLGFFKNQLISKIKIEQNSLKLIYFIMQGANLECLYGLVGVMFSLLMSFLPGFTSSSIR